MDRCNKAYIKIKKAENHGEVKYTLNLSGSDKNTSAASKYVTFQSLKYEYNNGNMTFTIKCRSTKACSMSFFDPPNGKNFMKINKIKSGSNTVTIKLSYKKVMEQSSITMKFYNFNKPKFTGYLFFNTNQFKGITEFKDLYGNTVKR